tara:strand:- start:11 stop:358 length:348 start_codon:yes stop_codon:yes gene_type:complete
VSSIFFTFLIPFLPQHLATLGQDALAQDRATLDTLETARDSTLKRHRLFRRARHGHAGVRPALPVATQGRRALLELDDGELEKVVLNHAISIPQDKVKVKRKKELFFGVSKPSDG